MDSGTNALDILCGRVVPLKIGYVAVVNRSQRDTQQGKGIRDSLRNEEEFFKTHPAYRTLAHRCGTAYLAKTLNKLLVHHIRERLPEIRRQLTELTKQTSEELATYGEPVATADESQRVRLFARRPRVRSQRVA